MGYEYVGTLMGDDIFVKKDLNTTDRLGLDVSLEQLEKDNSAFMVLYDGKAGLPSLEVWEEVEGRWREVMEEAEREERRRAEEREYGEREGKEIDRKEEQELRKVTKLREEL